MSILIRWAINCLALVITAYLIEGISVESYQAVILAAFVLGIVNAIIRPIFLIFTLPLNVLTLGLFTFVINGLMLLLTASIVKGFVVQGLIPAIIGSIILSLISFILTRLIKDKD